MNRLCCTILTILLSAMLAPHVAAQLIPPNSSPPPVSPPLLARPVYDPHPPAEPEVTPRVPRLEEPPAELRTTLPDGSPLLPPESGLTVTPGHYVSGCLQLPIYQDRGPYVQTPPWLFGEIPFEYDGNVSQANRNLFQAAMDEIETYCNVTFRARTQFDTVWIHVQSSAFNNAPIGTFPPGQHIVNIFNFNFQYIMIHELFHVLGIYHEQSRTDRDNYVVINTANICQTCCGDANGNPTACNSNFDREDSSATFGVYNFDSFMHYPRTAFSTSTADTITVRPAYNAVWQNRIGQRDHLSFGDRCTAIRIYQPGWAKVARINSNPNGPGTWSSPYNNFPDAYNAAPQGGDVIVLSGYYTGLARWSSPRRVHAPDGNVRIGQ